jgi:hypothetical protein
MKVVELKEVLNKIDELCNELDIPNIFDITDINICDDEKIIECNIKDNSNGEIFKKLVPLIYNEVCGIKFNCIIANENEIFMVMVI